MFAKFCNILSQSVAGISKQHLNHPNLLARIAYHFHVYFQVRIIKDRLSNLLTYEDGLNKVKNSCIKVRIIAFAMIMMLKQMKYGCMVIGFIKWLMKMAVMAKRLQKSLHPTTLHDE